jgi:multicomponent Na+:H+ antiporter subunit B
MKWVYIIAGIAFYIKMLLLSNPSPSLPFSIVDAVVRDSGVPNVVSGIILRNRLYDTIFEVIVFTIAIMGAHFLLANEHPLSKIDLAILLRFYWRVWERQFPRWWVSN